MEEAEEAKEAKLEEKTPVQVKASWRELSINNIESLACVADRIHPAALLSQKETKSLPRASSSSHKAAWVSWKARVTSSAAMSSPIPSGTSNLRLWIPRFGEIASDADQYYIHDLAILPKLQGRGLVRECINKRRRIRDWCD